MSITMQKGDTSARAKDTTSNANEASSSQEKRRTCFLKNLGDREVNGNQMVEVTFHDLKLALNKLEQQDKEILESSVSNAEKLQAFKTLVPEADRLFKLARALHEEPALQESDIDVIQETCSNLSEAYDYDGNLDSRNRLECYKAEEDARKFLERVEAFLKKPPEVTNTNRQELEDFAKNVSRCGTKAYITLKQDSINAKIASKSREVLGIIDPKGAENLRRRYER